MADAIVSNLLATLRPILQGEMILLSGVREEIKGIRDEFEHMTAFLEVAADSMEEIDPELKVWVRQVREAAFDTEDVIDVFMFRIGYHQGNNLFGKIYNFTKTLPARHQIASKVQEIKSRVIEITERHQRYRDRYGHLDLALTRAAAAAEDNKWHDSRGHALLLEETEVVGIEKPKSVLIQRLISNDPELKAFSVVGMGGLGKTTLAKKVFDDLVVKKHFHIRTWVTVSETFQIEKLLKGMIHALFSDIKQSVPREVETMDLSGLKAVIKAFLQQKRYLVVFDDVWDVKTWETLRIMLPDSKCGGRVMLTTRNVEVAQLSSIQYNGKVCNQLPLSPNKSWKLFCRTVFQNSSCPSHLESVSRNILKRCEGLPLAIVAIGGLLSIKDQSSVDEWERVNRSLGEELQGDKLVSLKKVMLLSYISLPYYLKLCFLYLSVFPEDCLIEHWRLIRLWVVEGFVQVNNGMEAEEVADGYLKDLLSRNLIQIAKMSTDGRVKAYRVHDLWREMIVSIAREHNLVTIANEENKSWPEKVRRFSIHKYSELIQRRKCFGLLRSLLVFDLNDSVSASKLLSLLSDDLKLVKVLELKGTSLQKLPNSVAKLIHLKYLSLRGTKVKEIPKWIGELKSLETLDLKHTNVTVLPVEILKLKKRKHLLLYRHEEASYYHSFHNISQSSIAFSS